ncbi:hypothetical protein RRG08_016961 [Elysia crispata]|uniref:BTB domain-containing protein n=1 Tax=Elysia crispata TaxID=231223 RepID=A0AAE0XYV7_9GAST|nr:hypothetical protein RRG08_016961 [Elysia crispata]
MAASVREQRPVGFRRSEKDFTHLRNEGEFSDATIHVGHVSFPVHRNILACCSPYFRALFTNQLSADGSTSQCLTAPASDPLWVTRVEPCSGQVDMIDNSHWFGVTRTIEGKIQETPRVFNDAVSNSYEISAKRNNIARQYEGKHGLRSQYPPDVSPPPPPPPGATTTLPTTTTGKGHAYSTCRSVFSQRRRVRAPCQEVCLQDVSADIADAIIEHAYGGIVSVTAANVEQLLTAADRFQVLSLVKKCCTFLLNELNISNCISIIKFCSRFYTCDALRKTATRFLLENFPSVCQLSAEFERLTHPELTTILRADHLNVKHEETVLDAIIKWVLADVGNRQGLIPDLVQCVRVGLMLPENMREFVDSWLVSSNLSSEFNQVTLQVMESVLHSQKQQMTSVDGAMFSPRLPRDILFVIGGSNFGFPLNLVEAFDCRTFSWSVICPYDFAPRSYHGMVALNEDIYVIGGFSGHVYLSSCCKLRADSLTWENVTPMNTKRCYVGAVTVKGSIYTVGGYDGVYRLNSAERFCTETNQWSFIAPMNQQRSDAGVAVLDDKVYVCGGFNGMECIRSVELYDPDMDCWAPLPSMPRGRSGLGLAAHNGRLYAVGGFDGVDSAVRLSVMESYDPDTCQWTGLEPMFHPRSNLAVEVLEDLLYAIGGYCGDRTTSAVECYDFDSNTWFESGQLSHNRSALGACVVSGLSNTADILRRNGPERCALVHLQEY